MCDKCTAGAPAEGRKLFRGCRQCSRDGDALAPYGESWEWFYCVGWNLMSPFGAIHRNSHVYELRWKIGDDGYRCPTFPAFFSIKPTQWIIISCGGVHRGQEGLAMV